eukprot:TRINITY_DN1265_c0_g1_i1.p1 TRINITY_DN1265_c0_g1~~TRINITY_DN1265_c0_g1_i1.p1  ORF type:complete len:168 (-),score=61.42 TRINITY_DN1265_c0_g1_i1:586-1089(-)
MALLVMTLRHAEPILRSQVEVHVLLSAAAQVFKYTHTNKRLAQFTDTLAVAYAEMVVLTAIIIIVCVGYGLAFTLAFGAYFEEYRNVTESLLSLFESVLGNFDVDKLRDARPVIGTLLFLSFIFLMFFVVVSMFLATVDKAYETVREALGHLDEHLGRPGGAASCTG